MIYLNTKRKKTEQKPISEKKICEKCQRSLVLDNFISTNNECMYPTGLTGVCRKCVYKYIENSPIPYKSVLEFLRNINKPFISSLWKGNLGKYLSDLNLRQTKDAHPGYDSSVFDGETPELITAKNNTDEIKELTEFWGKGFKEDEYYLLQNEYEKLLNAYECDSYAMELLFQEASHQRLSIKRLREANKSVDKELKTLQDLLGSANIKPVQETGANAAEQATFGTLIKKYENERPIPEPEEAWKDVDGIAKYMKVWFFGHFAKMLGMKNDSSEMYEQEMNEYKVEAPEYQEDEGVS